jgi:hypothetical protein
MTSGDDYDDLLASIDQVVADRRRQGEYPVGFEAQLEGGFAHLLRAVERDEVDTSHLGWVLDQVSDAIHGVDGRPPTTSSVPLGSAVHASVGRLLGRHMGTLSEQVRTLGLAVNEGLREVKTLVEAQRTADERQLNDVIAGILDRLAVIDHVVELVADLEDRVLALEGRPSDT